MVNESARDLLLAELDRSAAMRARLVDDPEFMARRASLRAWQGARLGRTHRDLLDSPRFHAAAEFFLADLYAPKDLSRHVENVRGLVPVMSRTLPDSGLMTVARAMELNALSDDLDAAMVETLGARAAAIDERAYAAAYRKAGRAKDRGRQIDLIALLGEALDQLTHMRFIGLALAMMRKPAQLAGLGELQGFLERGYAAFRAMRGGSLEFVSIVVARERAVSAALFKGDDGVLQRAPAGQEASV